MMDPDANHLFKWVHEWIQWGQPQDPAIDDVSRMSEARREVADWWHGSGGQGPRTRLETQIPIA